MGGTQRPSCWGWAFRFWRCRRFRTDARRTDHRCRVAWHGYGSVRSCHFRCDNCVVHPAICADIQAGKNTTRSVRAVRSAANCTRRAASCVCVAVTYAGMFVAWLFLGILLDLRDRWSVAVACLFTTALSSAARLMTPAPIGAVGACISTGPGWAAFAGWRYRNDRGALGRMLSRRSARPVPAIPAGCPDRRWQEKRRSSQRSAAHRVGGIAGLS